MEPLAAVSLAGNILQFIHSTRTIISTGREILDLGSRKEHIELELIAQDLRNRANSIALPPPGADSESDPIRKLGESCHGIADELLKTLEKLKVKEDGNKWDSFLALLRTEWEDAQLNNLRQRLDQMSQAVNMHLVQHEQRRIFAKLEELGERNQRLETSRGEDIMQLKARFDELFIEVTNHKDSSDATEGFGKTSFRGMIAETVQEAALRGLQYSAEQIILQKLRFDRLEDRYSQISSAHRSTLKWLFNDGDTEQQHVSSGTFIDWLESDDDLYWVSGRPGSGKSTMMKFLCDEPRTKDHLRKWAGNNVLVADYFFWNAGKNYLQKSQEGMLRSILYQLLRQRPVLVQKVFPDLWRLYGPQDPTGIGDAGDLANASVPTEVPKLRDALTNTCRLLVQSGNWLCLFIDGLDEYEGKPTDVIELIGMLKGLPHVKLCVSSRPWNEFEEAYGKSHTTKLYMQDFNDKDISAYIQDVFTHDENYQELEDRESQGEALVKEIVEAARGVFLWVVLVVRSFQEGLRNGDSLDMLQTRLRSLPNDLNDYFERILFHDVDDFYRRQAAQLFFVALEAQINLPLISYWFLGEALPAERKPLTLQQTNKRLRTTRKRILASCKGLLEPYYQAPAKDEDPLPSSILFDWKVDFLHRTVRDYLELPGTETLIRRWTSSDFDPHEAICKTLFSQVKTSPNETEYRSRIRDLFQIFYYHSKLVSARKEEINALLGEMRIMVNDYDTENLTIQDKGSQPSSTSTIETGKGPGSTQYLQVPPQGNDSASIKSGSSTGSTKSKSSMKRWASKLVGKK